MLKICVNCGSKISSDDQYCRYCGTKLVNKNKTTSSEFTTNDYNPNTIDVNVPAPNTDNNVLNNAFKSDNILKYKKLLGLNLNINNVLISRVKFMGKLMLFGSHELLDAKYLVMSFEKSGIVILGVDYLGHFESKNSFIPANTIRSISKHKKLFKNVLNIAHADTTLEVSVNKNIIGSPFQKNNVKNINNIIRY